MREGQAMAAGTQSFSGDEAVWSRAWCHQLTLQSVLVYKASNGSRLWLF
jgi:hypothetical protein